MRAQASLEFLVTYGWAIALIVVTLSWIAYMGFTSPTDFAGDDCRMSGEFGCEDAKLSAPSKLTASEASFVLRNLQPEKISVQDVIVEYDSQEFTCTRFQNLDGSDLTVVRSGEEFEVLCDDDDLLLPEGEKAKISFTITYNKSAGFPRKASGEVVGLVDDTQTEIAFCGDDVVNNKEECDDGADGDDLDGCTDACEFTKCSAIVEGNGGCTASTSNKGTIDQPAGHNSCQNRINSFCVSCDKGFSWDSESNTCEPDVLSCADAGGDGCTTSVDPEGEKVVDGSCVSRATCVSCESDYSWDPDTKNCVKTCPSECDPRWYPTCESGAVVTCQEVDGCYEEKVLEICMDGCEDGQCVSSSACKVDGDCKEFAESCKTGTASCSSGSCVCDGVYK